MSSALAYSPTPPRKMEQSLRSSVFRCYFAVILFMNLWRRSSGDIDKHSEPLVSRSSSGSFAASRRRIYIDLGANWCNTLRLYEDFPETFNISGLPWDVFAFEASPLLQSYADNYIRYLNGEQLEPPLSCLPPAGSTEHLEQYAKFYRCEGRGPSPRFRKANMRACMWRALSKPMIDLTERINPRLNSTELLEDRLAVARKPNMDSSGKPRFTFIPAAGGGHEGYLEFFSPPYMLIRGGAVNTREAVAISERAFESLVLKERDSAVRKYLSRQMRGIKSGEYSYRVPVVPVAQWIKQSFHKNDFVFMKIDIEGGEFSVFEELYTNGWLDVLDVVALECHPLEGDCKRLDKMVRDAGIHVIYEDAFVDCTKTQCQSGRYDGMDARSRAQMHLKPKC